MVAIRPRVLYNDNRRNGAVIHSPFGWPLGFVVQGECAMRLFLLLIIILTTILPAGSQARTVEEEKAPQPIDGSSPWLRFPASQNKSAVDTVYIMGGPDRWDGSFDTPDGQPSWHGWTHDDLTIPEINHWHISDYWAEHIEGHGIGNHVMYCGDETIPACSEQDTIGGVGDNFFDDLEWRQVMADPSQPATVRLTGKMNYDLTDTDWDFLEFFIKRESGLEMLASWTGTGTATLDLDFTASVDGGDFAGSNSDEVWIFWRVWSDAGYSDVDCFAPGHGACQMDDLSVFINDELITFDDFEPGSIVSWKQAEFSGVGDFTNLRNDLGDVDLCQTNTTYQVNFVDDGTILPTGGTPCVSACYDPGGWIVNNDGGMLADDSQDWFLKNRVVSPPIAWAEGNDAAELAFDVYVHETLHAASAGVFYRWQIRSTNSTDPADLENAPWEDRNFVHYGGPEYRRHVEPVGDLLLPGRKWVQIELSVDELGWLWGWNGADGTPAPYFDNIALKIWAPQGPEILVRRFDIFSDIFPTAAALDPENLGANSCRLDPSQISYFSSDVGDSMVVLVTPLRTGATVEEPPAMHWAMQCNPLFDSVRQNAPNGQGILRGAVSGEVADNGYGTPLENRWTFDLPDEGWFFPGDVLHYYITATDQLGGDFRTSVWPADTTAVLDFTPDSLFPRELVTRALPTLTQPVAGEFSQPSILLMDSDATPGQTNAWIEALRDKGLVQGTDFDVLKIVSASKGISAATGVGYLEPYQTIIYSSGENKNYTMAVDTDNYNDVTLLNQWLDTGGKRALFAGDGLFSNLNFLEEGPEFANRFGVSLTGSDISSLNGGHFELDINALSGNEVLPENRIWSVDGGCPDIKSFDAVGSSAISQAAATLDPNGMAGGSYAAVITTRDLVLDNRSIALPFDLASLSGAGDRADFLRHLMLWLSSDVSAAGDTPAAGKVTVGAHPNPFNPSTTIAFELPRNMNVSLDIFDVHGRHVRSLLDESPHISGRYSQVWDGRDVQGQNTASGVYFFRLQADDQKHVGKLTLLK